MDKNKTFAIVGLGLMGGSYAMALSRQGYHVTAIDKDENTIAWALQQGLVAEGVTSGEAPAVLAKADYVVLALYPNAILPWLTEHKEHLKPGALLTDLAGVKGCYVEKAQALLAPEFELIACHPMAGREHLGVQNADDTIFKGANYIVTPTPQNTPGGIAFAHWLANTLGFAHITTLTVQEHDKMIGYVSQLTHAIAVSLMNANADPRLPEVTGDSFRDLTRIADINAGLWSELFLANKDALITEIDDFTACLGTLRQCLQNEDKEGLEALFRQSSNRRRQFNKKPLE